MVFCMFYDVPRTIGELPEILPVFPLTGAILLPHCKLPLNIFEPRYLNMVFDSLKSERLIGMIQPRPQGPQDGTGPIYDIGCAGRITSFEETQDGRVLMTLTGLCRFKVSEEMEKTQGYRRIRPDWQLYGADLVSAKDTPVSSAEVIELLKPVFDAHGIRTEWHILDQLPGNDLMDMMIINLPFQPEEKQALLEAVDAKARIAVMRQITAIYAAGAAAQNETRH